MKNKASFSNKVYRKIHWILFSKIKPGAGIRWWYPAYRHGMTYRKRKVQKSGVETKSFQGMAGIKIEAEDCNKAGMKTDAEERSKRSPEIASGKSGETKKGSTVYLTQLPNEGAGIGHQIANYIGGVHYARIFCTKHAHAGFKDEKWEQFLGFGEGEVSVAELKKQGYRMLRLPYFDEDNDAAMIRDIIASYEGRKVILQTELDQFYEKQYEEMDFIKKKFEAAKARQNENNSYDAKDIHIAVHIRRGDIVEGQATGQQTLTKRWLTMEYYENAVGDVINYLQDGSLLKSEGKEGLKEGIDMLQAFNKGHDGSLFTCNASTSTKPFPDIFQKLSEKRRNGGEIILHIFSQGNKADYKQFEQFAKVDYCLDKDALESFLLMVRADILILSKSSFSYKPALLADGIRICPPHFWHGYPNSPDWIVADEDGHLGKR